MVPSNAGTLLSLEESEQGRSKIRAERSLDTHTLAKMNSGKLFHKDHHKADIFLVETILELDVV